MDGGDNQASANGSSNGASRWNPTKEQITFLEGMYRQGMRTPTAVEIQQITEKLKAFGSIEGKNVFYWFQNHKARQRQKQKQKQQQQQQSFGYFSRVHHHHHQMINPPLMFPTAHQNGVVCSPCYMPPLKSDTSFLYQQYPKVPLPAAGGGPFTKQPRASFEMYNTSMQASRSKSGHRQTLDLFPVQPTGFLQTDSDENGSKNPNYSSPDLCIDEIGNEESGYDIDNDDGTAARGLAFIDFFSSEN